MTTTRSMLGLSDVPKSKSEARRVSVQKENAEKTGNVVIKAGNEELPLVLNTVNDLISKLKSKNIDKGTFQIVDNKIYIQS